MDTESNLTSQERERELRSYAMFHSPALEAMYCVVLKRNPPTTMSSEEMIAAILAAEYSTEYSTSAYDVRA